MEDVSDVLVKDHAEDKKAAELRGPTRSHGCRPRTS